MSNKKNPQQKSLKKHSGSIENNNILIPKKENRLKHVLVANGNTSLGVNLSQLLFKKLKFNDF